MKFVGDLLKDWGIALGVVLVVLALANMATAPTPKTQGPAPAFAGTDLQGNPLSLAALDAASDVVILNFWFTSCPPCRHEIPELAAFHDAHPEVALVGISVDRGMPASRLAATSDRLGINYPVLHDVDASVAASYGVAVFPTTVVVREGQIVASRVGEVTRTSLAAMVDAQR